MICTFVRSSLLNEFVLCQGKCFISYNIGLRGKANKAALEGSCFHGVMELLALEKLAQQQKKTYLTHDSFGDFGNDQWNLEWYIESSYRYYDKESPNTFDDDSYKLCTSLVHKALAFKNGMMDPRKYTVKAVEYPFNLELKKDWAYYNHDTPNGKLEGYLAIKGTVDLICEDDEDTLWVTDYKTSKGLQDWGTGKEKTYQSLHDDIQLNLYFYALAHCFPHTCIIMNLYFVKLDKVFTIVFDRKNLPKIEEAIKSRYINITNTSEPVFIDNTPNKWKCRFCNYSKDKQPGTKLSVCNFYQRQLANNGMEKTLWDFADYSTISSYGAGGSSKDRE